MFIPARSKHVGGCLNQYDISSANCIVFVTFDMILTFSDQRDCVPEQEDCIVEHLICTKPLPSRYHFCTHFRIYDVQCVEFFMKN